MLRTSYRTNAWFLRRTIVAVLVLLAALGVPSGLAPQSLDWRLAGVTRSVSFDLWSWEVRTLADRSASFSATDRSIESGPTAVRKYVRLSEEATQIRRERDDIWARQAVDGSPARLGAAQNRLDDVENQLATLRPVVESTVSQEIESELRRQQVGAGVIGWSRIGRLPLFRPDVVPGVFFQLGPLPDLLVIAPRDRIELVSSVLVQPDLKPGEVDNLERRADGLRVSSVVTGIGGLAAFPSMVPDEGSIRDLIITVSHEWTHHYLALHPLGMSYFNSYAMREINETIADMVGRQVGDAVYQRYYAPSESTSVAPPVATPTRSRRPDFFTLMRRVRIAVEGYLARHDVEGADLYMAAAQQDLARQGYYVRRLNTAYLAFFGSYAATANPYELKLRQILDRSTNVDAFLREVREIRSPADLDRLSTEVGNRSFVERPARS